MSTGQGVLGCNMFCYCLNNPVNMTDESGTVCIRTSNIMMTDGARGDSEFFNIAKYKKTTFPIANTVRKTHTTTPTAMLDLGILLGKVGFSSTVTKQNEELGLLHSYSDVGNDSIEYGAGINIFNALGADVGVSSENNIFVMAQITPWAHGKVSIGLDGIGVVIGFDDTTNNNYNISHDLEIHGGWGLLAAFIAPQFVSPGCYPNAVPAY